MIKKYLFELVDSMTPAEKRLYKLKNLTYQKDGKLKALFDIFSKSPDYEKLEATLDKKKGFTRLGKLYSELYKSLLSFLSEQEMKANRLYKLQYKLFAAKNLISRNLFEQGGKILEKVIKEAEEYEVFEVILEAQTLKMRLLNNYSKFKNAEESVAALLNRREEVVHELHDLYSKAMLCHWIFLIHRKEGTIKDKGLKERYAKIIQNLDLDNGKSYRLRRRNLLTKIAYHKYVLKTDEHIGSEGDLYELYKNNERMSKLNIREYSFSVNNYLAALISHGELDKAVPILDEMEALITDYKELRFLGIYHSGLTLSYRIKEGNLAESLKSAEGMMEKVIVLKDITYRNYISVKITVALLLNGRRDQALGFINAILNDRVNFIRRDCLVLILIYEILIFIQSDLLDLAESKINSLNYFLKNHFHKGLFERWALRWLNQLIKNEARVYQGILQAALDDLKNIEDKKSSKNMLKIGEFEIWLKNELKLRNHP